MLSYVTFTYRPHHHHPHTYTRKLNPLLSRSSAADTITYRVSEFSILEFMSCVGNLNDDGRQTSATGKHLPSLSSEIGNVLLKEIPRLMNLAIKKKKILNAA